MSRLLTRWAGVAVVGGLVAWLARLFAHSKVPPPEGRWREVTEDDLA